MQSIAEKRSIESLQQEIEDRIISQTNKIILSFEYGIRESSCIGNDLMYYKVLSSTRCEVINKINEELVPSCNKVNYIHPEIAYYTGRLCGCTGSNYCDECIIPGGAEGQVLIKKSGEDGDYGWEYIDPSQGGLQDLNSVNLQGNLTTIGMVGAEYFEDKDELDFSQLSDITVRAGEVEW